MRYQLKSALLSLLAITAATDLNAEIQTAVPEKIDKARAYLFYLHGRIVETSGPRPVSSEYGMYDYGAILDALARGGALVVSAQRPPSTDVREYAGVVVGQIERLIEAGVPPSNISIVGFSKGGAITLYVSSFLRRPELHYVIQAGCGEWLAVAKNVQPTGHLLSIREKNDKLASSCNVLEKRLSTLEEYREIELQTGKGHGEFYMPRPEWLEPTLSFIKHDGT
jgi:hypothetical protein